jgi:hypothetical protein
VTIARGLDYPVDLVCCLKRLNREINCTLNGFLVKCGLA